MQLPSEHKWSYSYTGDQWTLFSWPYFRYFYFQQFKIRCVDQVSIRARHIIIIFIIIKKGRQCKAGRKRLTPDQSEDSSPKYQPMEWKKRKGKL